MESRGALTVNVNGLRTAYRQAGDGPPLLLLHGFSHDGRVWRQQLEGLSDTFSVIAWDAPGAGQSDDPPETFGMADCADHLAGLMDATDIERAVILGLSWGGIIAQEFYRRAPHRVRALVLADTYAGWKGSLPDQVPQQRLAACLQDSLLPPAEFVPQYLPGMFSDSADEQVREELAAIAADFHPSGFRMAARTCADTDTRDLLPRILAPTLLVWGAADARSPLSVAHEFEDAIPGAELAIIPGAGHVSNMESPARFNDVVREFCLTIPTT